MNKQLVGVAGLIVIVAAIGVGVATLSPPNATLRVKSTPLAAATGGPRAASRSDSAAPASIYKDGSYSADGSYDTPGGAETVSLSLTLKNGLVTDSTASTSAHSATGKEYQSMFLAGYKSQVVGKSLDSLKLSKVSGSSLTPNGFNNAVTRIRTESKA